MKKTSYCNLLTERILTHLFEEFYIANNSLANWYILVLQWRVTKNVLKIILILGK